MVWVLRAITTLVFALLCVTWSVKALVAGIAVGWTLRGTIQAMRQVRGWVELPPLAEEDEEEP